MMVRAVTATKQKSSILSENFYNTTLLTRFMLRRERITSLLWVLIFGGVVILLVPGLYYVLPPEDRIAIIEALSIPAMVSMIGPPFAERHSTYGALYTNFMLLFSMLTAALMNIFLVVRLTRADEEKGRYEVLRSLPVGRLSNLGAAMLTAVLVNLALALFVGLSMFGFGTAMYDTGMCFNGSILWGVVLGVTGLVFAAFTALFCQLAAGARTASAYSFLTLGFFYLLRAPGDMNADMEVLALIGPMGLPLRAEPYIGNYWWPVWVMLGIAVVVSTAAFYLTAIRDIDQGIIPARRGRAHGSFLMRSPAGLVVKLTKTGVIVWLASLFVLGASYGTVLGELDGFVATNDVYQQLMLGPFGIEIPPDLPTDEAIAIMRETVALMGFTVPQLFSAMIYLIMGIFATVPAAIFVLKTRSEENDIRAELVLATPVSRAKYFTGFIAVAFIIAPLVQLVTALGLYGVGANMLDYAGDFPLSFALQAALIYVPAIWVKTGFTVLLVGARPKSAGFIWAYFAYTFLFLFFGQGFGIFPEWMTYLSPYAFVQQLPLAPGETINWIAPAVKTAIAAVLTVAGIYFYGKRDINAVV